MGLHGSVSRSLGVILSTVGRRSGAMIRFVLLKDPFDGLMDNEL